MLQADTHLLNLRLIRQLPTQVALEQISLWRIALFPRSTTTLSLVVVLSCFISLAFADYPLRPVPFNAVEINSDFWRPRLQTQRRTLVPFAFERTQPGVEHLQAARDFLAGKKT